jgi:hypothetical protein
MNFIIVALDRSTKVAPVITQEFTTTLEDRIIERIKSARYDDPHPRNAVFDSVIPGMKLAFVELYTLISVCQSGHSNESGELSQEKSKLGLGEVSPVLQMTFKVNKLAKHDYYYLKYSSMPKNMPRSSTLLQILSASKLKLRVRKQSTFSIQWLENLML